MKRVPFFSEEYKAMNAQVVAYLRYIFTEQSTAKTTRLAINYKRTPFTVREDNGVLYVFKKNTFGNFHYVTWDEIRWYYTIPGIITQLAKVDFLPEYGLFSLNTTDCAVSLDHELGEFDLMGEPVYALDNLIDDPNIDKDNLMLYHYLNKELSLLELDSSPNKIHIKDGQKFSLKSFNRLRVFTSDHFNSVLKDNQIMPLLGLLGDLLSSTDEFFVTDNGLYIASYAEISKKLFPKLDKVVVISVPKLLRYFTTLLIDHQILVIDQSKDEDEKSKQTASLLGGDQRMFLSRAFLEKQVASDVNSPFAELLGSSGNFIMFSRILENELNTVGHAPTEVMYNRTLLGKLNIVIN